MNKTNSLLKSAIPSLVVLAAGLVAVLAGIAPKFQSSAADMINFSQLYVSAAITVFIDVTLGASRSIGIAPSAVITAANGRKA